MKKFLVLSALVITSCTLSNEEKAEKLVKETLKDYLYHPDSYEPISTRVDSMFIDVTTIEPIMKISDEIKNLISKINLHFPCLSVCSTKIGKSRDNPNTDKFLILNFSFLI